MELSVKKIAELVEGSPHGDESRVIRGAAGLLEATESDASFIRDAKKSFLVKELEKSNAGVIFVPEDFSSNGKTLIKVKNPLAAFAVVLNEIQKDDKSPEKGVHPTAFVHPKAKVGKNTAIGPFCVVEEGAVVGENTSLVSHVYVGPKSSVGSNTLLYPQVVLRERVEVGNNCIIHAGTVIGSDGYGFFFDGKKHNKIPQVGTVVIEDDVEIGSCSAVDRATTGVTRLRRGVKVDNLVQIAHNVDIGEHSLIVAQVGIAGSTTLGQGVVLAGQVGVADHTTVGAGTQVGAQSGIKGDIKPGSVLFGSPALPIQETMKQMKLMKRLPSLFDDVKELKEKESKK